MVQRQDIMVPGSSLQSCLWKEKVRFNTSLRMLEVNPLLILCCYCFMCKNL